MLLSYQNRRAKQQLWVTGERSFLGETAAATIINDYPPKSTKSATVANPVGSHIVLVSWAPVLGATGYALIATNFSDPSDETRTAAAARDARSVQTRV